MNEAASPALDARQQADAEVHVGVLHLSRASVMLKLPVPIMPILPEPNC